MGRTRKTAKHSTPVYVAYYRVSTDKQGISGLGLEAQRALVQRYIAQTNGNAVAEYTEIESGKNHRNRPQLAAALAECGRHGAILVIAKLDRLARNVAFISNLMESATEFVACDMPAANKLTLHIMAAMAEHEREMISQRTKAALAALKERGVKVGNPRWQESIGKALALRWPGRNQDKVEQIILDAHHRGLTLRAIAAELNGLNLKTRTCANWHASSVRASLLRAQSKAPVLQFPKVAA